MRIHDFEIESRKLHGDRYDYSYVEYKNNKTKVMIRCKEHDWIFFQSPSHHLKGQGCPKCAGKYSYTTPEWIERARKVHGDRYDYSQVEYKNKDFKVKIRCKEHDWIFEQRADSHIIGSGCPKCARKYSHTTLEFIEKARKKHGDGYDYSQVEYKKSNIKVDIVCRKHGLFSQIANAHLQGQGCPVCAGISGKTEQFIEKARKVHRDSYDYSQVEYKKSNIKVDIVCRKHGTFSQKPNDHLSGYGCSKCAGNYRYNTPEWIEKAKEKHGDSYDYSHVVYKNAKSKVKIRCKEHDWVFEQTPSDHLSGRGCPKCGGTYSYSTPEWIEEAKKVHRDRYDYSEVEYKKANIKVKIRCKEHDWVFEQTPSGHLSGQGCPKCGGSYRYSTPEWIEEAKKVHGDSYDYSEVEYKNNKINVKIRCKEHDWVFEQTPSDHLSGQGCPKCARNYSYSTPEWIEEAKKVHRDRYDYSEVEYKKANIKVKIRCKEHDWVFEQTPNSHLSGRGCPKCGGTYSYSTPEWIEEAKKVHRDRYDYSEVEYKNNRIKIKIRCKKHDWVFEQTPSDHLSGRGCPKCSRRHKFKEERVKELLSQQLPNTSFSYQDSVSIHINEEDVGECKWRIFLDSLSETEKFKKSKKHIEDVRYIKTRRRPDFTFDSPYFCLMIEVDENRHTSYGEKLEYYRELGIALAKAKPSIFLRYNPDHKGYTSEQKEQVLLERVSHYIELSKKPKHEILSQLNELDWEEGTEDFGMNIDTSIDPNSGERRVIPIRIHIEKLFY